MEMSHMISDGILCLVGLFVFFFYLLKLDFLETLLWSFFILSVTIAAFFGALKFSGNEGMYSFSVFFQILASSTGAIALATVSWFAVLHKKMESTVGYFILALGIVLFVMQQLMKMPEIAEFLPMICIPLVLIAGIFALNRGDNALGLWLIAGVTFAALATFRDLFIHDADNAIDVFHYLMALSLLSFGLATSNTKYNI